MKPVRQTRLNKGDGNCFNACVATLLDLPIEKVDVIWNEDNWLKQLDDILHPLGYCFIEWDFDNPVKPWHWVGNCYMIATGDGPRGCKHSVIVHHYIDDDGKHCVVNHWDPHPDERFLKTIDYVGVLFPHWEKTSTSPVNHETKGKGGEMKLTVILLDDFRLIVYGDNPTYRSVQIDLTPEQCAAIRPLTIGIYCGQEIRESISKVFIEPETPIPTGQESQEMHLIIGGSAAELTEGIQQAISMLMDYIDKYHDCDVPENTEGPPERKELQNIMNHLLGTITSLTPRQ